MYRPSYVFLEDSGTLFLCADRSERSLTATGASLVRCYGYGADIEVAEKSGFVSLANRVFAPQSSWQPFYADKDIPKPPKDSMPPVCAEAVRSVSLPWGLSYIGDYAFYDCRNLESLSLTQDVRIVGANALMNCIKLNNLKFKMCESGETCLSVFLSEMQGKVTVSLNFEDTREKARLIFPAYFEEATENAPARIFEYHTYGSGLRYRQCVKAGRVDFHAYDTCFPFACIEEDDETLYHLILMRLEYPYKLSKTHREMYVRYISNHMKSMLEFSLLEDNMERAEFILSLSAADRADLAFLAQRAAALKRPAFSALFYERARGLKKPRKNLDL